MARNWFDVIALSDVHKVTLESFLEEVARLSDILKSTVFAVDHI